MPCFCFNFVVTNITHNYLTKNILKNQKSPTTPAGLLYRQDTNGDSFRDLHQNYHTPIYDYALDYLGNDAAALNSTNAYFVSLADRFSDFEQAEELVDKLSSEHKKATVFVR